MPPCAYAAQFRRLPRPLACPLRRPASHEQPDRALVPFPTSPPAGYPDRSLVIYDGLHYDALAVEAFEGAPEELDVTAFEPGSQAGSRIQQAAEQLVG